MTRSPVEVLTGCNATLSLGGQEDYLACLEQYKKLHSDIYILSHGFPNQKNMELIGACDLAITAFGEAVV